MKNKYKNGWHAGKPGEVKWEGCLRALSIDVTLNGLQGPFRGWRTYSPTREARQRSDKPCA